MKTLSQAEADARMKQSQQAIAQAMQHANPSASVRAWHKGDALPLSVFGRRWRLYPSLDTPSCPILRELPRHCRP